MFFVFFFRGYRTISTRTYSLSHRLYVLLVVTHDQCSQKPWKDQLGELLHDHQYQELSAIFIRKYQTSFRIKTTLENLIIVRTQLLIHKSFTNFAYVWENAKWSGFFLISFSSFLKVGHTLTYFRLAGKWKLDKALLKLWYMNKAILSLLPLMIGNGISLV